MKRLHAGSARILLVFFSILFLTSGHLCSAAAATRIFDVSVTRPVAEVVVALTSVSTSHTMELRNFGPQADPIIHLLNPDGLQVDSAVARDGRLVLTVPPTLS